MDAQNQADRCVLACESLHAFSCSRPCAGVAMSASWRGLWWPVAGCETCRPSPRPAGRGAWPWPGRLLSCASWPQYACHALFEAQAALLAAVDHWLSLGRVQAHMPAEHLASQAPSGATAQQQLNGLASLHKAIAHNRYSLVSQWYVRKEELQPEQRPSTLGSAISPDGSCAAVNWSNTYTAGYHLIGDAAAGGSWSHSLPAMALDGTSSFSTCSQFFTCLHWEGSSSLVAKVFDTRTHQLLHEVAINAGLPPGRYGHGGCSFAPGAQTAAVMLGSAKPAGGYQDKSDADCARCLAMYGATRPFLTLVEAESLCSFLWSDARSILLLSKTGLARFELGSWSQHQPQQLHWEQFVDLPCNGQDRPCMALSVSGDTVWMAYRPFTRDERVAQGPGVRVCFKLFSSSAAFRSLASWTRDVPVARLEDAPRTIIARQQAFIVEMTSSDRAPCTLVFGLHTPTELGQLLYRTSLSDVSASQNGRWLAGRSAGYEDSAAAVIGMHTGSVVSLLVPMQHLAHPVSSMHVHTVEWAAHDPSLLMVKGRTDNKKHWGVEVSFCVFKFSLLASH